MGILRAPVITSSIWMLNKIISFKNKKWIQLNLILPFKNKKWLQLSLILPFKNK